MKPLTRYISLLLVCGLMLPLHQKDTYIIGEYPNRRVRPPKPAHLSSASDDRYRVEEFSFFKDVLANILPALKHLR